MNCKRVGIRLIVQGHGKAEQQPAKETTNNNQARTRNSKEQGRTTSTHSQTPRQTARQTAKQYISN
jgi:hypothetical protein